MSTMVDPLRLPLEIDLFEGPFDLLLTLVLREEIELAELPLVEVVEAALGREQSPWDPATTGELVLVLAAMVELKSKRMVGEDDAEEEPDLDAAEARERLAAQLIAYAPFPRVAAWLAERAATTEGPRYRRVPLGAAAAQPAPPGSSAPLAAAMAAVVAARPVPSLTHFGQRRLSLPELLIRLRTALNRGRTVSFESLVRNAGRVEEAMTLLAALELARRGEVRLDQQTIFGDIAIHPRIAS